MKKTFVFAPRTSNEQVPEQVEGWLHFAVRPKDNRRRIAFLKA